MAYWCHYGRYPREIRTREATCERQGCRTYHERRNHSEILAVHQEMLEFLTNSLATNNTSAAHGLEGHF
jgi:hypothetical protein